MNSEFFEPGQPSEGLDSIIVDPQAFIDPEETEQTGVWTKPEEPAKTERQRMMPSLVECKRMLLEVREGFKDDSDEASYLDNALLAVQDFNPDAAGEHIKDAKNISPEMKGRILGQLSQFRENIEAFDATQN